VKAGGQRARKARQGVSDRAGFLSHSMHTRSPCRANAAAGRMMPAWRDWSAFYYMEGRTGRLLFIRTLLALGFARLPELRHFGRSVSEREQVLRCNRSDATQRQST